MGPGPGALDWGLKCLLVKTAQNYPKYLCPLYVQVGMIHKSASFTGTDSTRHIQVKIQAKLYLPSYEYNQDLILPNLFSWRSLWSTKELLNDMNLKLMTDVKKDRF